MIGHIFDSAYFILDNLDVFMVLYNSLDQVAEEGSSVEL